MSEESVLTRLARLEHLIRRGLSLRGGTKVDSDAYASDLREAVEDYLHALSKPNGMDNPLPMDEGSLVEHD